MRVAGSQVTGSVYDKAVDRRCAIVAKKNKKIMTKMKVKKEKKNGGQTLTHAALRMSNNANTRGYFDTPEFLRLPLLPLLYAGVFCIYRETYT